MSFHKSKRIAHFAIKKKKKKKERKATIHITIR